MCLQTMFSLDTSLVLVALGLVAAYVWYSRTDPRLPPMPSRPWPIIGHLMLMKRNPRGQLKKWRRELGDIYCVYIGSSLMVILNSYDVIKEALVKRADMYSDRPQFYYDQIVGVPNRGIMAASGNHWKEQRSVSFSILRSFGMGKNILAEKIQEEVSIYLNLLGSSNGQPTDIRVATNMSVANVIFSFLVGQRFDYDDAYFQRLITLMNLSVAMVEATNFLNFLPFLRFLPGDLFHAKKLRDATQEMTDLLARKYLRSKGYDDYDESNIDNFIAAYIKEKNRKLDAGEVTTLDDEDLLKIIMEFFGAGMSSTSSTILWCILYLLHHPQIQDKVQEELDAVVGRHRSPDIQDKSKLVYTNAVVMETQRLASVVALSAPHLCSKENILGGFVIPKGATIIPNLDSILSDEKIWGADANSFRPDRFIDAKGCLIHPEELTPFSMGKRLCLGESIAKMELFLYLSSMLHRFSFHPEVTGSLPETSEVFGIVVFPGSYKIRIIDRRKSSDCP